MKYNRSLVSKSYDKRVEAEERRFRSLKGASYRACHFMHLSELEWDGASVLEIGAGTGHFTEFLLGSGAEVEVTDLSPVQLEANFQRMSALGLDLWRGNWSVQDAEDLSSFQNDSFDVVVCFGGILNVLLEKADKALDEMFRVTKPNGKIVLSFMTLLGTVKAWQSRVLELLRLQGADYCLEVIRDKIVMPEVSGLSYPTRLYMVDEVIQMAEVRGGEIAKSSGTDYLATNLGKYAGADITNNPRLVNEIVAFDRVLLSIPSALESSSNVVLTVECGGKDGH